MNSHANIKFLLYSIVSIAFFVLFTMPLVNSYIVFFAIVMLLPAWFLSERRDLPRWYYIIWLLIVSGFVIGSFVDMLVSHRHPLIVLPMQLIVLQIGRLFTIRQPRMIFQSWLIALAMIIVAAFVNYSFLILLLIIAFFLLSVSFLMKLTASDYYDKKQSFSLKTLFAMSCWVFLTAIIMFMFIPRFNLVSGNYPLNTRAPSASAWYTPGFTTNFYLGTFRYLLQDDSTVLEINLDNIEHYETLYLRGSALSNFDGFSWNNLDAAEIIGKPDSTSNNREAIIHKNNSQDRIHYQIRYCGLSSNIVFGIPPVVSVTGGNYEFVQDNLHALRARTNVITNDLHISSRSLNYQTTPLYYDFLTADERATYLRLPGVIDTEKISNISNNISEKYSTERDKAEALAEYLRSNYIYSLTSSSRQGRKAIEDFLFHSRQGHCELFATALVLMLRSVDIPSRLVAGYIVNPHSSSSSIVPVKNNNAHAWVEAYCDAKGWFLFDPTPPAPLSVPTYDMLFMNLMRFGEKISETARHYISGYGEYVQRRIITNIISFISKGMTFLPKTDRLRWLGERLGMVIFKLPMIIFLCLLLVIDGIIIWLYLMLKRRLAPISPFTNTKSLYRIAPAYRLYRQIIKWMGVISLKDATRFTLSEIADLSASRNPDFESKIRRVVELYYYGRYSADADWRNVEKQILAILRASSRRVNVI